MNHHSQSLLPVFAAALLAIMQPASAGLSDSDSGRSIGAYSLGNKWFGTDVAIYAASGQPFDDPAACAGDTSDTLVLPDTADQYFRTMLAQIMTAAALKQKVTFYLSTECYDFRWGLQYPVITGIHVYAE